MKYIINFDKTLTKENTFLKMDGHCYAEESSNENSCHEYIANREECTLKGKYCYMIRNVLTRRREYGTYLATYGQ